MRTQWSSRRVFLLATIGGAVGIGNLWRFPYIAGDNGGAAFVLIYALCVLVLGVPLLCAELTLGRLGRRNPVDTIKALSTAASHRWPWMIIGWLSIVTPATAIATYGVVAGWTVDYAVNTAFSGGEIPDGMLASAAFESLIADPRRMVISFTVFVATTAWIVSGGIHNGLERAINIMMPAFFLLLLVLLAYSVATGSVAQAAEFLFRPDFSQIDGHVFLMALGQAFFSLGIGIGAVMVYGAYLPAETSIPNSAAVVATSDTLISIIGGMIIFPLVFEYGLDAGQGPGLVFVSLPIAFGIMPFGAFVGALFFALLAITALTTSIALLEPGVSWAADRFRIDRGAAARRLGALIWLGGCAIILSLSRFSDWKPLSFVPRFSDMGLFDLIDFLISAVFLPTCGLLIALFAGWTMSTHAMRGALAFDNVHFFSAWRWLCRYVAPVFVIALVLAHVLEL